MENMTPDQHIEQAEELMASAHSNLGYYGDERKTEKAQAQATLALAHIELAKWKDRG